jgi:hypothetical protein
LLLLLLLWWLWWGWVGGGGPAGACMYDGTDVHVCMYIFSSEKNNKIIQCTTGCDITHIVYHLLSHRL